MIRQIPGAEAHSGTIYYPAIDGLRFLSAFLVIFHHAPALPGLGLLHKYGWIGVDVFLCISAYLIVKLLRTEYKKTSELKFLGFFARRALRIMPLYFFYVTALFIISVFIFSMEIRPAIGYWLSHLVFVNNIVIAVNGYTVLKYTEHLWTISLEEQAYILIPFIVYFISKFDKSFTTISKVVVCLAIFLIMCRLCFLILEFKFPFTYTLLFRADAFLFGGFCAIMTEKYSVTRPFILLVLGITIMLTTVILLDNVYSAKYQLIGHTFVGIGTALVVLFAQSEVASRTILGGRVFRYLGKVSYGIYVYHLVAIAVCMSIIGHLESNILTFAVSSTFAIVISIVSYEYFEKRFLRLRERFVVVESRPI